MSDLKSVFKSLRKTVEEGIALGDLALKWQCEKSQTLTFATAANSLHVSVRRIEELVDGEDVLEAIVGMSVNGGMYEFRTLGERQIEIDAIMWPERRAELRGMSG